MKAESTAGVAAMRSHGAGNFASLPWTKFAAATSAGGSESVAYRCCETDAQTHYGAYRSDPRPFTWGMKLGAGAGQRERPASENECKDANGDDL
jgi:hypothetical protein